MIGRSHIVWPSVLLGLVWWQPAAVAQEPPAATPSPQAVVFDLERAVVFALRSNPGLKAVEERRRELEAGVQEVRADAWPQLTLTSSWSRSRNPSFLNSPDFEDIIDQFPGGEFEPAAQTLYSVGMEISQPLYTFGKIAAAVDLARVLVETSDEEIRTAALDTAAEVAEAYFELLTVGESLAAVESQQRTRSEALAVVQARYDLGEATRLELLRSRSALAEVAPAVAEAEGAIEVAQSRLRGALGLGPGPALQVSSPAGDSGSRPPLAEPPPLTELLAAALERRPELAGLELQRQALARRQQVTRAESKPQLDLNGFFGRQARLVEDVSDPLYDNWSLSVGLSWELFDGGRRRGQVAQLESQRRQLALELDEAINQVLVDIERELADYRTSLARHRASQEAADSAREAARVARESYQEGVALLVDWLDAQQREIEAEILEIEVYFGALAGAARLSRAIGALPTEGWPLAAGEPAAGSGNRTAASEEGER